MIISNELKQFIENNVEWIDLNNYQDLYRQASQELDSKDIGELTTILHSMDINPLDFMSYIPYGYFENHMLEDYKVPDHINVIEQRAFRNTVLDSLDLNKVNKLDDEAFQETMLTEIYIPKSVTYIGDYCFNFSSIGTLTYEGTKLEWEGITKSENWNALSDIKKVYCSDGVQYVEDW